MTILTQLGLGILFKPWSLGRKIIAGYSLAFIITIAGILIGLNYSKQIQEEALAIQAEAVEDVEKVNHLQGSLLKMLVHEQLLWEQIDNILEYRTSVDNEQFQIELAHFVEAHQELKQSWQEFQESDEFDEQEDDEAEGHTGVTETEAEIASSILEEHQTDVNDYLQQVNALVQQIDPSGFEFEQLFEFEENLLALKQRALRQEIDPLIEKITALAEATEEEQEEAVEVLEQGSTRQIKIMLASILLSGMTGILVMYVISRLLLHPLKIMTKTARQSIQEKNFDLKVPVRSQDEVGILAKTFNTYMIFVKDLLGKAESLNHELKQTLTDLKQTQAQVIQNEKMSSLGQLVAGIAHEVNNPVNFIHGNLKHLQEYTQDLLGLVELYQEYYPDPVEEITTETEEIELDFIQEDLPKTLDSMKMGSERIREIVLALRIFSRLQEAEVRAIDLHEGLDSSLMILRHRLKACPEHPEIQVIKDYGDLPLVECFGGLINQVFMNIISNGIDALEEVSQQQTPQERIEHPPQIKISTTAINEQWVKMAIADNGPGIPEEIKNKIFEPFFTTKPAGKGTGMGMSISYQIVTERHNGKFECFSTPGMGTEFVITIPVQAKREETEPQPLHKTIKSRLIKSS